MPARGVLWDVGNVIVRWNPRTLYSKVFEEPADLDRFLSSVCTMEWNVRADAGESLSDLVAEKVAEFPEHEAHIGLWWSRWPEMLSGVIEESEQAIFELDRRGVPQFGLTNMALECWAHVRTMTPAFDLFRETVVSAAEREIKPGRRIFEIALQRTDWAAGDLLFIDDSPKNIETAKAMGFETHLFDNPSTLHSALRAHGLL